jgi:glucose 1-dehydrogenase
VLDRNDTGPKVGLVTDLGATFHTDLLDLGIPPVVIIERSGHGPLVFELGGVVARDVVICLTGISCGVRTVPVGSDEVNKAMVLEITVLFGSVDAVRRPGQVRSRWLQRLITRRLQWTVFGSALHKTSRRQSRCRPELLSTEQQES